MKNCISIKDEWLKKRITNKLVIEALYFKNKDGKKYYIDNKKVVLEYSNKELEIANLLVNKLGGKIILLPRINEPIGIKTADYLYKNELWDLKEIRSSGKRAIDNRINGNKNQSHNYIIDITDNLLSNKEIINQIKEIYNSKDRIWLDKIILIRNQKIIIIYKRK